MKLTSSILAAAVRWVVLAALFVLLFVLMPLKAYRDYQCAPAEWLYMYGFIDRKAYHARPGATKRNR